MKSKRPSFDRSTDRCCAVIAVISPLWSRKHINTIRNRVDFRMGHLHAIFRWVSMTCLESVLLGPSGHTAWSWVLVYVTIADVGARRRVPVMRSTTPANLVHAIPVRAASYLLSLPSNCFCNSILWMSDSQNASAVQFSERINEVVLFFLGVYRCALHYRVSASINFIVGSSWFPSGSNTACFRVASRSDGHWYALYVSCTYVRDNSIALRYPTSLRDTLRSVLWFLSASHSNVLIAYTSQYVASGSMVLNKSTKPIHCQGEPLRA